MSFLKRLASARPILLDGATGTEVNRGGVNTGLPLWGAGALLPAPQVLTQIHADSLRAGAEMVTANTFRTHRRSLARAGPAYGERAAELTRLAVDLARAARVAATASLMVFIVSPRIRSTPAAARCWAISACSRSHSAWGGTSSGE